MNRILALIVLASVSAPAAQAPPRRDFVNLEPWFVFFDSGKASIDSRAEAILDHFVTFVEGQSWNCTIEFLGHTDRAGPEDYNLRLGLERAKAVVAYLRRKHVTVALEARSAGETLPLVETPDGVADPQNRRVEWSACM